MILCTYQVFESKPGKSSKSQTDKTISWSTTDRAAVSRDAVRGPVDGISAWMGSKRVAV